LKRFEMIRGWSVFPNWLRINVLGRTASIGPFTEPFQNVSNHFKIAHRTLAALSDEEQRQLAGFLQRVAEQQA
jgi:hypothetical protein